MAFYKKHICSLWPSNSNPSEKCKQQTYTARSTAAFIFRAKPWKQPRSPTSEEQIPKPHLFMQWNTTQQKKELICPTWRKLESLWWNTVEHRRVHSTIPVLWGSGQAKLTTGAKKYEQWWLLGVVGNGNDWKMEWGKTLYFDTDGITQASAFVKIRWSVYFLIYKIF